MSALGAKRTLRRWWMGIWWRVAIIVSVILIFHYNLPKGGLIHLSGIVPYPALNILGLLLTASGVGLAVWARVYLGRNWGMPLSIKENPELVTTGPYAYIRNPIYTGVLLATLGSSLFDWWWIAVFAWSAFYFIYASYGEEKIMLKEFPDTYPAYKARTWALIPFIY